ncbi:phage holin family protein [Fusobacterium varium]|uniref:phage holin family protein n=1 Tax=Fusobacterium varium TaxID=856 RepID=UPI0022E4E377|nr:phage holin family protein [Fusobacterium varium]
MVNLIKTWGLYLGSGCLSLIIYLIGGYDILIKTLLVMMVIDYITGIMKGYKNKNINSNIAYRGLRKKVMVLFIVMAASQMDVILQGVGIRTLVLIFYVATEFLSILENAAILGIPIPEKLKVALEQCRDKQDIKKTE